MSGSRHPLPLIVLHWTMAVLLVWMLWLGWSMLDLPKGPERSAAYGLHKSLGLLLLGLLAVRIAIRLHWRSPPSLSSGWQDDLAMVIHRLLYMFMLLAPLAGYLASSFTPYPLKFFGVELPKLGWPDEGLNEAFKAAHFALVWGGAALIALHVAGALKHALQRDGIVQRMLPGRLFRD
ncbi:MAG: cytochrome b/b6 domain-containing protein [Azonexaceae bacterium]|nr:cytochrome b/b6 domain-containing protein [Azonexaceae bacterium]